MEQASVEENETKVQIIESTCLFNKKLNKNNAIDGTNIIYLAGSSIVFHNIFQSTKRFVSRISDNDVIGMAFFKSSQNIVALATNSKVTRNQDQQDIGQEILQNQLNIELYILGQQGSILAQLGQDIEFIDMQFLEKKKVVLLVKQFQEFYFYFLEPQKKPKKRQVNIQKPKGFIAQDRRIAVIGQKGMKDLDVQLQNLSAELRFQKMAIEDYVIIDNQFQIILSGNKLYCYRDLQLTHNVSLNQFSQNDTPIQAKSIVRVGRNLLVAHRNAITLSHFTIDNNNFLKFLNNYTYKQRIKGGIFSMQVSFDQMHLAMSVQLIQRDFVKIQNFMFNLSILSSEKKFINPFIRLIPLGTESFQITSLQGVIPFQTYYLTANTIVNYSYNDQVQKKFKFGLHQTPKLLAAHPLGYQFVCLFQTQIKFYLKIQNQIVQIWNQQLICSYAKYTMCGNLLLSCLEDSFYQLIVYDTNHFKRIKNTPNVFIKHPITKIQLAQQDSQVIMHIGHDLSIYKLKTGQKIAEYRQKKQKDQISALAYDPNNMIFLASTTCKNLIFAKKVDDISWEFKVQKVIQLSEEITYIVINSVLQTVFMGTKSGKLLWTQYPLNFKQNSEMKYTIQYQEIKLSPNPISQIHLTNNLKYLFISFKNQGLVICKLRKIIKYHHGSARYNEFDISNLNFLQTSSKNSLQSGTEKLKALLQKRKTVFNDLDQYKKEWQMKKNKKMKDIDTQNKHKQLNYIKQALGYVQKLKKQKNNCFEQLKRSEEQTSSFIKQKQEKYQKQIMLYYDKNIDLRVKRQRISKKCESEFNMIEQKCRANIEQIDKQLKQKYEIFMQNYHQMKKNLVLYEKRVNIEKQQAQQILLQLFNQKRQKLKDEQLEENKKSNQLKALITKYKKQSQRYQSRRYFLESKRNFFMQQLNFCKSEKGQLTEIKGELQSQLKELQVLTNKKEKRLRRYFNQNQILTKYQMIHNNLVVSLDDEVKFIDEQKYKTGKNIVSIQKELSQVAELNETYEQKIQEYKKQMIKTKQKTYANAEKNRYLMHIIEQMTQAIERIKTQLNQQNKVSLFGSIYKDFFIRRKLQKIIQSSQVVDLGKQEEQIESKIFDSAQNKKKVLQNMKKHKNYLEKNMMLFQKHNKKTDQEMNLNFLKYQTQNYNLIAECNVRKEQTNKKKRILHELIDSVKQTQLYMNQLQKQSFDESKLVRSASHKKSSDSIPFIQYKRNKQQMENCRFKVLRKQQSEPSLWKMRQSGYQVRKMLDIQKAKRPGSENKPERRIKTAMIKNRTSDHMVQVQSSQFITTNAQNNNYLKKPMTASGKRHQAPFGQYYTYNGLKNKSASKPTTCTTHTNKQKLSIYN